MTPDGLLVVKALFSNAWLLMTSWKLPGTNTTPAMFFMAILFVGFSIRNLGRVFHLDVYEDSKSGDITVKGNIRGRKV